MTKKVFTELALQTFRALCFIQNDSQIHWLDKKALIVDYVRYIVKYARSIDSDTTVEQHNTACVDSQTAKDQIIHYIETMYGYNSPPYLDILFGEGNWKHLSNDIQW